MHEINLVELSRFVLNEAFCIGQETVATGIVQRGFIEPGDELVVVTPSGKHSVVKCSRLDSINSESGQMMSCDLAGEGDAVGLWLTGITKQQLEPGSLFCRFQLIELFLKKGKH